MNAIKPVSQCLRVMSVRSTIQVKGYVDRKKNAYSEKKQQCKKKTKS